MDTRKKISIDIIGNPTIQQKIKSFFEDFFGKHAYIFGLYYTLF